MPPGAAFCPVFGGAFTVRSVTFSVVMGDGTDLNGARGADSHGMGNTRPRLLPHARLQAQGPLRRYEHAAVAALNFHDIYNDDPAAASAWLAAIRGLLKPGGVFGVIDHIGNSEADNATLHRIEERLVIDAVEAVGFRVEATSDVLRNSDDDRTKGVFDPSVRGHTDRFVLRLRSP